VASTVLGNSPRARFFPSSPFFFFHSEILVLVLVFIGMAGEALTRYAYLLFFFFSKFSFPPSLLSAPGQQADNDAYPEKTEVSPPPLLTFFSLYVFPPISLFSNEYLKTLGNGLWFGGFVSFFFFFSGFSFFLLPPLTQGIH